MTESLRLTEYAWDDAASLVDHLEKLCQQNVAFEEFSQELVEGIAHAIGAADASLWEVDDAQTTRLAHDGIETGPLTIDADEDGSWTIRWPNRETLLCRQRTDAGHPTQHLSTGLRSVTSSLVLRLRFEQPVKQSLRLPAEELCSAVLGIAALVWLRHRYSQIRQHVFDQSSRDRIIGWLHSGSTFSESLGIIGTVLAQETGADRVSVLEVQNGTCRLATSSVVTRLDHRSRHVRSMQELACKVIRSGSPLTHLVGREQVVDPTLSESLDSYVDESGSREIRIEIVTNSETDATPIAAILLERFRLPASHPQSTNDLETRFRSLSLVTFDAIRFAFRRDHAAWQAVMKRWLRGNTKRKMGFAVLTSLVVSGVLAWLPVRLTIPVEGRLVPNQHVSMFASNDATVELISVKSGQSVKKGETLMVLRSSSLDLQEKTLAGELATVQSQLSAVQASKSGSGRDASSRDALSRDALSRDASVRTDQRVLEAMIANLRERLALVQEQQRSLVIKSPMDGIAQRLDLQQSLLSRPIMRGQRLINVVEPAAGWTANLDVPDNEIGYVIEAHQAAPAACHFRLRSDPAHVYQGRVERIENTSHLSPDGKSVVRVIIVPDALSVSSDVGSFRVGATVMASIHCGDRPAGFVWFRSFIEWVRRQSWI